MEPYGQTRGTISMPLLGRHRAEAHFAIAAELRRRAMHSPRLKPWYSAKADRYMGLISLAKKYIWWKKPETAVQDIDHLLSYVMTFGTFDDVNAALELLGEEPFRDAIRNAPPGVFNIRSWNYWHLKLKLGSPPPLPIREIPDYDY